MTRNSQFLSALHERGHALSADDVSRSTEREAATPEEIAAWRRYRSHIRCRRLAAEAERLVEAEMV